MRMRFRVQKGQNGQISIMVAILIATFLFFMAFVVNTGLLVSAKINLQNAADLAAYAGAAVQARQLNHASFLNYEMRRQYKKFLFRYYVLGNYNQRGFPNPPPGGGDIYRFAPNPSAPPYGVPVVCTIFSSTDNYCQVAINPEIRTIQSNPLDPISTTLNETLRALEQIRLEQCQSIGTLNQTVLSLWLLNSDPQLEQITQFQGLQQTPEVIQSINSIRGLASGLGLLPRNLLLLLRTETLEYYLNFPAQTIDPGTITNLQNTNEDRAARERPIQAYQSAYKTLGEHMFDEESIILTELLPGGEDQADLVQFNPIELDFDTYYVDLTGANNECKPRAERITVNDLPVGIAKDPNLLTYYSIRLEAEANPMYSLFGKVRMKAYSAAQPFGSRVGPTPEQSNGFTGFFSPSGNGLTVENPLPIPNLPLTETDSTQQGWHQATVLRTFLGTMAQGKPPGAPFNQADYERGYQAAMAPNPSEARLYNIINDLEEIADDAFNEETGDPFVKYFGANQTYAVWAPIVSRDQVSAGISDAIQQRIAQAAAGLPAALRTALAEQLVNYVGSLQGQLGADGETFDTYPLRNPFKPSQATENPNPFDILSYLMIQLR